MPLSLRTSIRPEYEGLFICKKELPVNLNLILASVALLTKSLPDILNPAILPDNILILVKRPACAFTVPVKTPLIASIIPCM